MAEKRAQTPLIRPRDLIGLPGWLLEAPIYALGSTSLLLSIARLRGSLRSLSKRGRRRTYKALATFYGERKTEAELLDLTRRHLEFAKQYPLAQIWPDRSDFDRVKRNPAQGYEHIEAGLVRGKGVFILMLHVGYPRLIKHWVREHDTPAWLIARQLDDPDELPSRFEALVRDRLLRLPRFLQSKDADLPVGINLRPIVQALARNEVVIAAADGHNASQFVTVRWLGQDIPLATGGVSTAKATGATLLPALGIDTTGRAEDAYLVVGPPLPVDDAEAALKQLVAMAEEIIEANPHIFTWQRLRRVPTAEQLSKRYLSRQDELLPGRRDGAITSPPTPSP